MMPWLESLLLGFGSLGWLGMAFFILSFTAVGLLGLPIAPVAVLGGAMFGFGGGLACVVTGTTLGATVGFFFSRYVARRWVEQFLQRHPKVALIDRAIRQEGWKVIGLLRICPIPFGISNYAYGLMSVAFRQYLPATFLGMLPGEIAFVSIGAMGRNLGEAGQTPLMRAFGVAGVLAMVAVFWIVRNRVAKRLKLTPTAEAAKDSALVPPSVP
jgi:uncharacterized membrane protein YdjX (TVP38/TMEM64 family)